MSSFTLHLSQMREKKASYLFESSRRHKYSKRGVRKMLARYAAQCNLTDKFAGSVGIYMSAKQNGEDMSQISAGKCPER